MRPDPVPSTVIRNLDGKVFATPKVANEIRHALRRAMSAGQWSAEAREFLHGCEFMGTKYEDREGGESVVKPKNPVALSVGDGDPGRIVETMGITEAAAVVGMSRQGMQKRIDTGKVADAYKDGCHWRIPTAQAQAMRAERIASAIDILRKNEAQYLEALALLDGLREDEPAIAEVLELLLADKLTVVRAISDEVTNTPAGPDNEGTP